MTSTTAARIRPADDADTAFILALVPRFVEFDLPPWRDPAESASGVRRDLARHLAERPEGSYAFVAEIDGGHAVGVASVGLAMRAAVDDELVVGMHDGDRRFSDLRAAGVEHDQIGRAEALPGDHHELIVSKQRHVGDQRIADHHRLRARRDLHDARIVQLDENRLFVRMGGEPGSAQHHDQGASQAREPQEPRKPRERYVKRRPRLHPTHHE